MAAVWGLVELDLRLGVVGNISGFINTHSALPRLCLAVDMACPEALKAWPPAQEWGLAVEVPAALTGAGRSEKQPLPGRPRVPMYS